MSVVMRSIHVRMAAFGHLASSKGARAPAQGGRALAPPLVLVVSYTFLLHLVVCQKQPDRVQQIFLYKKKTILRFIGGRFGWHIEKL
jgi:hypothetical protein